MAVCEITISFIRTLSQFLATKAAAALALWQFYIFTDGTCYCTPGFPHSKHIVMACWDNTHGPFSRVLLNTLGPLGPAGCGYRWQSTLQSLAISTTHRGSSSSSNSSDNNNNYSSSVNITNSSNHHYPLNHQQLLGSSMLREDPITAPSLTAFRTLGYPLPQEPHWGIMASPRKGPSPPCILRTLSLLIYILKEFINMSSIAVAECFFTCVGLFIKETNELECSWSMNSAVGWWFS